MRMQKNAVNGKFQKTAKFFRSIAYKISKVPSEQQISYHCNTSKNAVLPDILTGYLIKTAIPHQNR